MKRKWNFAELILAVCFDFPFKNDCLVYSIGIGALPHFDLTMASEYDCTVHSFDHTIDASGQAATDLKTTKGTKFHLVGLGPHDHKTDEVSIMSLNSMRRTFSDDQGVDVLKIDCEGCEWSALGGDLSDSDADAIFANVNQVMFELHLGQGAGFTLAKAASLFRRLHRLGFRMFYRNLNPWSTGARESESLVTRMRETKGAEHADRFVNSKENMIRMGNEAGYGWREAEYELWKRHVDPKRFVCCFEVGFVRV